MVEGSVDHRVGLIRTAREATRIPKGAAMHFGAGRLKPSRATVRAGKAEHLMPGGDEFGHDPGADEAGRAGKEHTHGTPPNDLDGNVAPCLNMLKW